MHNIFCLSFSLSFSLRFRQEGVSSGIYRVRDVVVTASDGTKYDCRTYEMLDKYDDNINQTPSSIYKDYIMRGAKETGLPEEYIAKIKTIADNGYNGRVDFNAECGK